MRERSEQWSDLILTARTHNVAAQPTTLGKRVAMFGEELLVALGALEALDFKLSRARAERRGRHADGPAFPVRG
jgi:adenylosuccinate lyase